MEDARLAQPKRRMIMFEKRSKEKNSMKRKKLYKKLENTEKKVIAEKRKRKTRDNMVVNKRKRRDNMVVNHENCSLHSLGNVLEPWNFGPPSYVCNHCGVVLWYEERSVKSKRPRIPKFSLCCMEGKVKLPLLKKTPPFLNELLDPLGGQQSKTFRTLIRSYNTMFAMTSMGGKVDNRVNDGTSPYIFKLNGQTHHRIGTLLPNNGEDPQC